MLIVVGGLIGSVVGLVGARTVKMTAMPQMVALFNGVGGGAAALVALAEFHVVEPATCAATAIVSIVLSALIGSISFAGSMIAFAKLQELLSGPADRVPGPEHRERRPSSAGRSALGIALIAGVDQQWVLIALIVARADLRRDVRAADRRRGHAGRDLAAERVHGPRRVRDRLRPRTRCS